MTTTVTTQSDGLYHWYAENLRLATQSLNSHWQGNADAINHIKATRIITDTRTLQAGDIFLALKGMNFDGHHYIHTAIEKGAVAVIVSEVQAIDFPQLIVEDTRLALGLLGAYRRNQHPNLKVIAITGSRGKTTGKEMLGSILTRIAPTLITRGNLNNDLGVPMMLLEISDQHQFAVLELGANHLGEIAYTTQLVKPDVACILNIGTAHLGEFGSRENICLAKAEIYQGLTQQQTAVVPDNDDFSETLYKIANQYTQQIIGFGQRDVSAKQISIQADCSNFQIVVDDKVADVGLSFIGEHNISNALASTACALALGVSLEDIAIGLNQAKPAKGRLTIQEFGKHRLIDDTYNANPHAVRAAAHVLKSQQGRTMLVLGDIAELGDVAKAEHYQLGQDIAKIGIDVLYCVGEFASNTVTGANEIGNITTQSFSDKASLSQVLQQQLTQNQTDTWNVLFKGSRSMQMETLIADLMTK